MTSVRSLIRGALILLLILLALGAGWIAGRLGMGSVVDPASLADVERKFADQMKGATLVGQFTVDGRDAPPGPDRYEIESIEKVGVDQWRFNARIRPAGAVLPIVVPLRWIGDTPVIMMTDYSIPAVGTFTVRVLFYGDRYVGTWQHGRVGGQMFGRIETAAPAGAAKPSG
jgi:hypothetical protein